MGGNWHDLVDEALFFRKILLFMCYKVKEIKARRLCAMSDLGGGGSKRVDGNHVRKSG